MGKREELWQQKLQSMTVYERPYWERGELVAGIDEAGRGPLAGPVVAACVVMDPRDLILGIDDSKKISEKRREAFYDIILEKAVDCSVYIVDNKVIDEINILEASKKAMLLASLALEIKAEALLVDGPFALPQSKIPQLPIKKGDSLSASIAAASILAKNHRDRLMVSYDKIYPQYGFARHKGYPTAAHRQAIKEEGLSPIHRKTFKVK